jgi:hypothetical protein
LTAVRVFYVAGVIVMGAFAVLVTSFLDTHHRADLVWALALLVLGVLLAVIVRVLYSRLDPADRRPITPDSKRRAVVGLLLGTGVSGLGILGLYAAAATGAGVGHVLVGVAIIALGIWMLLYSWRTYRRTPAGDRAQGGP